ncbi:hypothetical protein Q3C01_43490 [Bradyrhizobium sp. UFLA05-109]
MLGVDGISDSGALHPRVVFYVVDFLTMGEDLLSLPLHMRKTNLEQLLERRPDGITVAPFVRAEIEPDLVPKA